MGYHNDYYDNNYNNDYYCVVKKGWNKRDRLGAALYRSNEGQTFQ